MDYHIISKWSCGKGVQANSVQCTVCKKWIHRWCSGDFSRVADGFRCRRCDGTIQEADLAEGLMVEGETCGCVNSFYYPGDTLREIVEWILLLQLESEMDG